MMVADMAKAKVLTKDEMKRVEKIIAADSNATRNMLAFKLSILGGMRVGEVAALTVGQVRGLDGKAVAIINLSKEQTKGHCLTSAPMGQISGIA